MAFDYQLLKCVSEYQRKKTLTMSVDFNFYSYPLFKVQLQYHLFSNLKVPSVPYSAYSIIFDISIVAPSIVQFWLTLHSLSVFPSARFRVHLRQTLSCYHCSRCSVKCLFSEFSWPERSLFDRWISKLLIPQTSKWNVTKHKIKLEFKVIKTISQWPWSRVKHRAK